ncbi:MAG: helix-turn-helix domain-containing protein [Vallitalea sp.]|jgi:DNA transposition AAA+ family ATPase|nr:helix-turn-helix domain-containing protein [Vallitalea sp.]
MILKNNLYTNIYINNLEDLKKLKPLMEVSNLKINKSQIARELGVDARTVSKYINGYTKPTKRKCSSKIDKYYDVIKELLSEESIL